MSTQVGYYEAWIKLMRSWGFTVHEAAGWRTRDAEPRSTYLPGLLYIEHYDASTTRSGNWGALNYIINNKLANIVTARDGQITVVAAGVAWHAGVGSRNSLGNIPANGANSRSMGNEVANSGSEPYSDACTRSIIAGERAWAEVSGRVGEWERIIGHKEWADPPGRKVDPRVDMDQRRRDVAAFQPGPPPLRYPVYGAIHEAFLRNGGVDRMGQPLGPEQRTKDPQGLWQNFEKGGRIFWHPEVAGGAYAVVSPIEAKFKEVGLEIELGFPTTDVHLTADGVGRFQHFQRASIFWHPDIGAHVVRGAIRERWASLNWEIGFGYPIEDEKVNPDGVGSRSNFAGQRSIYWHPETGAQPVINPIRAAWGEAGWEQGAWGYPAAGESGGVQPFQGGTAVVRDGKVTFTPKAPPLPPAPPVVEEHEYADPEPGTRLRRPVQAGTYRITSGFGPRNGAEHRGVDFASVTPGKDYSGAPIFAAEDGEVIEGRERENVGGFGGWVWLRHTLADGRQVDTIYGHVYQRDIRVKKGDRVKRGQVIAKVGDNGDSDGAHLHFEVWTAPGRVGGTAVDPSPYLGKTVTQPLPAPEPEPEPEPPATELEPEPEPEPDKGPPPEVRSDFQVLLDYLRDLFRNRR